MSPSHTTIQNINTKNTNLIVVNSNERTESKNAIIEKFPDAKFVKTSDKDFVDTDDLKKLLVKNKINYVFLQYPIEVIFASANRHIEELLYRLGA